MAQIYILRGPVQAGKTTNLKAWCERQKSVDGILAPVMNDLRQLYHISSKEMRTLETDSTDEPVVNIGKYSFLVSTFRWARECIIAFLNTKSDWIIIDEIGPLELKGQGLEPAVGYLLSRLSETGSRLIMVVREDLVHEVVDFYSIDPFKLKLITLSDLKYIS